MAAEGDDVPDLASDHSSEEEDEEEWQEEMDVQQEAVLCLFCNQHCKNPEELFCHCHQQHSFDIVAMQRQHHLDCINYIKLINYIRKEKPVPDIVMNAEKPAAWDSDDYMKPQLDGDALLLFDVEHFCENSAGDSENMSEAQEPENDLISISAEKYSRLLHRLKIAEDELQHTQQQLQETVEAMKTMRGAAAQFITSSSSQPVTSSEAVHHLKDDEDDAYFSSYGHFGIHQTMLQDTVRTESYRDAILQNKAAFQDKVVLDVGCGTGILSMFAAAAGARLVIGVDMSDVAYQAMDIVKENKLEDKIKIIKGRLEDVDIPVDKVDIIISEWMGYFLLFESMLDSVIWARDHYLKDGGLVLPNSCNMSLVGLDDADMYRDNYMYWDNVYGFKMSCMKTVVVAEANVLIVNKEKVLTEPCIIKTFNCQTCSTKDLEFSAMFKLSATRSGQMNAIAGYFDTEFTELSTQVSFSTGPTEKPTHWKQTVFILEKPLLMNAGEIVEGKIICTKHRKDPRSLKITLTIQERTQCFNMC